MSVVIIDYESGNLRSAEKSFARVAQEEGLNLDVVVSNDPEAVRQADRIVLPGVGAYGDCIKGLKAIDGMIEALSEAVQRKARPFMGICVGMQMLADQGLEHGQHEGLGWIGGQVVPIEPTDPQLKIPHMGWNALTLGDDPHPLFDGIASGEDVYFVHSYHMLPTDPAHRLATVEYGGPLTAAIGKDTIVGTQFHPEKSQAVGLKIIGNFLKWKP